ncbi:MAG: molybdopterin cofactor-binding domain-containing protein [Gemmatimonadota bacterium]
MAESTHDPIDPPIETERYELHAPPSYRFTISRRRFVESVGAGVIVFVAVRNRPLLARLAAEQQRQAPQAINAWLHIAENGAVTVYTGKVEVGQDIRTSLTQAVAEELHVAPASISLVMGDTDLTPYDQGTFGSRTTPAMAPQLRRAAAAARIALIARAAEQWNADAAGLTLADGRVTNARTRRSVAIGELTKGEKLVQTISGDVPLAPASEWRVAGKPLAKVAGRAIVTGKHRYPSDIKLPGMLIGKVLRPPAAGATLVSVDTISAQSQNVTVVSDGDFAGVAAPDAAAATRALSLLKAEWNQTPQPSQRELFEHLKRTAQTSRPNQRGSFDQAYTAAEEKFAAVYTTAYIAHVPLEPRAAVAQWENGKLTVWTGTQRPFGVRSELARAFGIPEERVRVLVPDTGSGYGGKHTGETAIEAARLARAANRPVKVVWTREEEFAWAYFRPAALIEIKSGAQRDGTLTAWEFHNYNAGGSALATPYDVPNQMTAFHPSASPLRQGSYRGLAATANNFARETHMDEIAAKLELDPLAFRLKNLREPRLRAALEAAAEKFGWSKWRASAGRGIGLACGTEKGGLVASCAEVAVDRASGRIQLIRIVTSFECGAIVNPDGLRNQVEGAVVQGLGGALWEAIEFDSGRILNPRLSQYRVPRMSDVPPIELVLLDRKDLPSAGAGEAPIMAIAPAIGNAIYRASGTRLRSLPLIPNGLDRS